MSCAIVGGTGYTAGELIRLLLNHPYCEVVAVQSSSQVGIPITAIHRDLVGESDLCFCENLPQTDVLFLCLGHGLSSAFLEQHQMDIHTKVIDLGNDFRLSPDFGDRHFTYGLPELNRSLITQAMSIANPGCFATAIQLALLPLAYHNLLKDEVHIHAITGSTGAGRGLTETAHFSYRNNNISVYKPFTHQHLLEIHRSLSLDGKNPLPLLHFIPVRGNYTRGIFATLYTRCPWSEEEAKEKFINYYHSHPFTHICNHELSLKEVVNTNKCLLHIYKHNDYLLITSTLDNLLKGASGQAVQNMNLMFGFPETLGLQLKSIAF